MATIFKDIVGADRGFNVYTDIVTQTIDGVDLNVLWRDLSEAFRMWSADRAAIVKLLTFDTTLSVDQIPVDAHGWDFELASEFGTPKSGRVEPDVLRIGFPLLWFDTATRFTRKYLRDATSAQIEGQADGAMEADNRNLFRHVLRALLNKTQLGSRPLNENGVPIYSLYSGSTDDVPPDFAGRSFAASHNHYMVSGGTVVDGADLRDLIRNVTEHGYATEGGERIVLMVNPQEGEVIRSFRAGLGSPISPYDFIPSEEAPAYLTDETIIGDLPPASFNGLPIIGSYGNALIFESYYLPAGYMIATVSGGAGASRNPLAFRQHPQAESRGLRLIPGNPAYPLVESVYERGFGVGVRNRGAAAVMQIKASGSYDNPSIP